MPAVRPTRYAFAARVMLVPYLAVLAWVVFAPAREAGRVTGLVPAIAQLLGVVGVPFDPAYLVLEFLANIALFVPLGALLALASTRLPGWAIIVAGFASSVTIELVQLALPSRFSTVSDVVANTLGTGCGLLVVVVVSSHVARRTALGAAKPESTGGLLKES